MNREVLDRLRITADHPRILDMGCGLGATLRSIARQLRSPLRSETKCPYTECRHRHQLFCTAPDFLSTLEKASCPEWDGRREQFS
jgi:hypothetical protein